MPASPFSIFLLQWIIIFLKIRLMYSVPLIGAVVLKRGVNEPVYESHPASGPWLLTVPVSLGLAPGPGTIQTGFRNIIFISHFEKPRQGIGRQASQGYFVNPNGGLAPAP